jgi:hypothetical protein
MYISIYSDNAVGDICIVIMKVANVIGRMYMMKGDGCNPSSQRDVVNAQYNGIEQDTIDV